MVTLRRARQRHNDRRGKQDVWHTFSPQGLNGPSAAGLVHLAALDEIRIPPGGDPLVSICEETEVVTYVFKGVLAQEDSTGSSEILDAGEFQRMAVGGRIRCKEKNASRTEWAHFFRISLHPAEVGLAHAHEQKRFPEGDRDNRLGVIASPDGRSGSLRLRQNALIFSSVLKSGHHIAHELLPGRTAWLHVIHGEVALQDLILRQGDGVGMTDEHSVSMTARDQTEILLVDLGPAVRSVSSRSAP